MPPALSESDDSRSPTPDYDIPASIPQTQVKIERETEALNEGAEEQLENDLVSAAEDKTMKKGKGSRKRKQEKEKPEEPAPTNGNAEENDEEDVYVVENIIDHIFKGRRCFYRVRWENYTEDDDTWEPEENLLPQSAEILGKYQKKIGGAPQPPKSVRKTASKAALKEESTPTKITKDDNDSGEPPSKRAKRAGNAMEPNSEAWKREPAGNYVPLDKTNWEDLVYEVETVEREETGTLYAFIRFKNGKRSRIGQNMYTARCPRAMLRFYESHLSV